MEDGSALFTKVGVWKVQQAQHFFLARAAEWHFAFLSTATQALDYFE